MKTGSAETPTNQSRLDRRRNYAGPVFLCEGFRPMFLAAGLCKFVEHADLLIGFFRDGVFVFTGRSECVVGT